MNRRLVDTFLFNAGAHPEKACVCCGDAVLDYGDVSGQVLACADALRERFDIRRGDNVVISAVSSPDYVVAFLAAQYLGAVTIPVDKLVKPEALGKLVEYVNPKLVLAGGNCGYSGDRVASLRETVRGAGIGRIPAGPAEMAESDVAEMLFTTGTTGTPKAVMLANGGIREITRNTIAGIGMLADDVVLIPLPLNHSVGMRVLRSILTLGATAVLQDGFAFAKELEVNIVRHGCTGLVCVPTSIEVLRQQMQSKFAEVLGRLRYIELGAGSLSIPMKRKIVEELPGTTVYNTWGSSETGGAIFLNVTEHQDKLSSLGKPVNGVEFAVLRPDGTFGPAGDPASAGRMSLKGGMRMSGYYNLPDETSNALRGEWLVTNDLAYSDSDGFVYMLGRADDIINVGGEKVAPVEVENIAIGFEGVRECACIGVADPLTGQAPVLFYATEGGDFSESDFKAFVAQKAERHQVPRCYVRVDSLPRNRMSKLDRKALRKMWENFAAGGAGSRNAAIEAILARKSIRDFTDEAISKEDLETIVKCGIHAPSAHNMQTWRFTVITNADVIARLKDILARKAKSYKTVCYGFNNPSAVILVTNDRRNRNAAQDCACAAENMMLAAHSLGLGSVWNNAISYMQEDEEVRQVLEAVGVPAQHLPWLLLLMGHRTTADLKSPQRREDVVRWVI
jgi:long-chain acyl-CoA synthetase